MESPVKVWRNQKKIAGFLGQYGTIASFTIIRVPPSGFENQAPYPVAVIRLDNDKSIVCQLVDWEDKHLMIDQKVQLVIRRVREPSTEGIIPYGIKAKPIDF